MNDAAIFGLLTVLGMAGGYLALPLLCRIELRTTGQYLRVGVVAVIALIFALFSGEEGLRRLATAVSGTLLGISLRALWPLSQREKLLFAGLHDPFCCDEGDADGGASRQTTVLQGMAAVGGSCSSGCRSVAISAGVAADVQAASAAISSTASAGNGALVQRGTSLRGGALV